MESKAIVSAIFLSLAITILSCKTTKPMNEQNKPESSATAERDTTPRVIGLGGIFFFSENTDTLKNWYADNLGFKVDEYGATFETRNANRPDEVNYTQWSPFKDGSTYFAPSKKDFMINYRVQNIEGLVRQLRENGVTICDEIETYDYGKFVHIMDLEGNKIELWEPIDHVLTEFGDSTGKVTIK